MCLVNPGTQAGTVLRAGGLWAKYALQSELMSH